MSGLVHLPRMADKARAYRNNTLGEYLFPCPVDKILLDFLEINAEQWVHQVTSQNEEELVRWVEKKCSSFQPEDLGSVNRQILDRKARSRGLWKWFFKLWDNSDSSKNDVATWVDLIDLEEGRPVPG